MNHPLAEIPTGRYAPSPTGSLHLGNLRTAVAAFCAARSRGMRFLLRIEDLDQGRCRPEFEARQLADLRALEIEWDAEPIRQSERADVYAALLDDLKERRLVYPCFCSRKDIADAASAPHAGDNSGVYPGTCLHLSHHETSARIAAGERHCWRIRVDQSSSTFFDAFRGECTIDLRLEGGDFVVKRADGWFAYQFACAVDDALSGVTEVLRGGDLLDSGARQAYILACLRRPVPRYLHIPLLHGPDGRRLAKRIGSEDLTGLQSRGYDIPAIIGYLGWTLGQNDERERLTISELSSRWQTSRISREDAVFREEELAAFRE